MNLKKPVTHSDIFGEQMESLIHEDLKSTKSILVTGAQGMLGNAIAIRLNRILTAIAISEWSLVLASRNWSKNAILNWEKYPNVKLVENHEIATFPMNVELVIHTASPSNITKIETFESLKSVNLGLIDRIAPLGPRRIVFISSSEVYRGNESLELPVSTDLNLKDKRDWYPAAKSLTENALLLMERDLGTEICIIRLFHTFGPGVKSDDGRSFADILWGAVRDNVITLKSNGDQVRTFLYLADATEAIIDLAFDREKNATIFNLGSSQRTTILEFAEKVANATNASIRFTTDKEFLHSKQDHTVPCLDRMTERGWKPKYDLDVGINHTLSWIKANV